MLLHGLFSDTMPALEPMSVGLHIDRVGALIQDEQWDLARVMSQSGLRLYPEEPQFFG